MITETIPSYLYLQYSDDENLKALVEAYNVETQKYIDWFNSINLPIYTGLEGDLLDWVGAGLYGFPRPNISTGMYQWVGALNTRQYNDVEYNGSKPINLGIKTSDDLYKRLLTWRFYKGDGFYFSLQWLKRRVERFIFGVNGLDIVNNSGLVSVQFNTYKEVVVTVTMTGTALDVNLVSILQYSHLFGYLELPTGYNFQFVVA